MSKMTARTPYQIKRKKMTCDGRCSSRRKQPAFSSFSRTVQSSGVAASCCCTRRTVTRVTDWQTCAAMVDGSLQVSRLGAIALHDVFAYAIVFMLHQMHEMQTIVTDDRGSCPSVCRSTWLYCGKTAERIEILFEVNTLGGPRNIVLDGGSWSPPQWGWVSWEKCCPFWTQLLHISRLTKTRDLKFGELIECWGPDQNQNRSYGGSGGVTLPTFKFRDSLTSHIPVYRDGCPSQKYARVGPPGCLDWVTWPV